MFRESTTQSSFFEVENYLPGVLPDSDWCYIYKNKVLPLIDEKNFKHLFSDSPVGQPNTPVRTVVSILIFMGMEKLSWRMTEFQFQRRLDWLIATNTPFGESLIDHTTLFKFYQRLEADDTARELFVDVTNAFIEACGTSLKKQRTDSFFVHGWLQLLTRYGLFKETIRKFLQVLRKQQIDLYENVKEQLSQNYLDNDFDLTEKDKDLAHRKIKLMAQDLYELKSVFENNNQIKNYETFKILVKVFEQQCEIKESDQQAENPEIIIKEKPDGDTINTPHNPEARYKRKVHQQVTGDIAFVTETCDPENKVQFITDAQLEEATHADPKEQPQIQKRLIENEFKPDQQYGDAGFVNGQTILDSEKNGIELKGPTAGRSQSFESYNDKDRPFDAGDFDITIDDETNELTINECPNNQQPKDQKRSEKTGKINIHFDPQICNSCPNAHRCPVKIGKTVATYTVSEAGYVGAVRHHKYMTDPAYRKECAVRAGAEAMVSELVRGHGMRKSRHRKRSRTQLQLLFAVIACNVKRYIRYEEQYAQTSLQMA